jgi:hypothetical protein
MAQKKVIVLVCDLCGTDDLVDTHRIAVDGQAFDAEACDMCWAKVIEPFAKWSKFGRQPRSKTTRTKAVEWPGTPWQFSSHALQRMGERHITPEQVLRVVDDPEVKRPGSASDQEVWHRGAVKVVVVPERRIIVTTALR